MEDHNIFAVLTPKDEKNLARSAFHLPENASRFHKATRSADSRPRIDCQEPNSPLSIQSDGGEVARWNASDRIILTFDQPPKNPSIGWQFGTSKTSSDVLLGNRRTEGISAQQCRITVDQKGWIFLHDDCSLDGTGVDYDHKKYDEELGETWILAQGPGFRIRWKEITIHAGCLAFRIEFPNHQAGDPKYRDNIRCLFQNSQAALSPFNGLIPSATVPGMAYQGGRGARYMIRKKIGQGGFGRTYHAINLRNGLEYAVKDFIPPKGNDDCEWKEWREMIVNETRIMWNNLHVSASLGGIKVK